jgi:hypothetical protein
VPQVSGITLGALPSCSSRSGQTRWRNSAATPSDFDEVIRHRQWSSLRRQGPYPLGGLLVAVALLFVHQPSALIAFGMCLAWGISTLLDCRSIRAASLWQHAWAQEDVRIDLEDEGLRLRNARGSGFIRWDSGAVVRLYSSCFVVEEFGEEIAVIPKRYLNSTELLTLQNRADVDASAPNRPLQPSSGAG